MTAKKKVAQSRTNDGQYTFDKMDRPCVCGHTLGAHAAVRAKRDGKTYQHCMADECFEPESDEPCDCDCFKPKRKSR